MKNGSDIVKSNEIIPSKLRNLTLTSSIVSILLMPHSTSSQSPQPHKTPDHSTSAYIGLQANPYLLFNPKDIDIEYPNRRDFLETLMHSNTKTTTETKQINQTKTQILPLSFAKHGVQKYFPERSTCFYEIISTLQEDPHLSAKINTILDQTVMKPTTVHKETRRRQSNERNKVGAILIFLEGLMNQNNFSMYIDQQDKLNTLSCDFANRPVSDTLQYETRLAISDAWIMPGEMIQRALEADKLFQDWIRQQKSGKETGVR